MSNPATINEEVHLCARCKAIIESERTEAFGIKEDSGVHRVEEIAPQPTKTVAVPIPEPLPASKMESDPFRDAPPASVTAPIAAAPEEEPAKIEVAPEPTKTLAVPVEDLRTAPRRKLEVDVGIRSDSHFFAGLSGDVSKGGLFVATYAEVPLGGKVMLDFELPNGAVLVEGTVRWQRVATDNAPPGIGIQFENVAPAMLALIERFCKARPPLYYDQADDDF
jgi:uncharacterized protein (TIGR02266 family)